VNAAADMPVRGVGGVRKEKKVFFFNSRLHRHGEKGHGTGLQNAGGKKVKGLNFGCERAGHGIEKTAPSLGIKRCGGKSGELTKTMSGKSRSSFEAKNALIG